LQRQRFGDHCFGRKQHAQAGDDGLAARKDFGPWIGLADHDV
jgi:hypothetical protein